MLIQIFGAEMPYNSFQDLTNAANAWLETNNTQIEIKSIVPAMSDHHMTITVVFCMKEPAAR